MTYKQGTAMAALVLVAGAGCSPRSQPEDTAAAIQAVTAAGNHEVAMFSSGNVDSVLGVFTVDALVMPPDEPAVHGRDSLRLWTEGMYRQFNVSARYPTSDATVAGDWAIQRYSYVLTLTPKAGGQPTEEHGKGVHVYRRQPDGRWLITQDIWNSDAPPPAPQR